MGYRFKREIFIRWCVCLGGFFLLVIAAWFSTVIISKHEEHEHLKSILANNEALEKDKPPPVEAIETSHSPLLDFIEKQRRATGFNESSVLYLTGKEIEGDSTYDFEIWWSRDAIRLIKTQGTQKQEFVASGAQYWAVTDTGHTAINDSPVADQLRITQYLLDPFSGQGRSDVSYRLLIDENYDGQLCKVVSFRKSGEMEARLFFSISSYFEQRRLLWLVGRKNGQREIIFTDYQNRENHWIPGQILIRSGDRHLRTIHLNSAEIVQSPDSQLFKPVALSRI